MAENLVTVLIIDDDRGLLRLMQKALRHAGISAAIVESGDQALAWLSQNNADLLLVDLKLQDIGGRELVEKISQTGRSIPFVVITGQGDERIAVEMMKSGALDYLVKDAQFLDVFPEAVKRLLDQLDRDKKLKAAEEALRVSEERFRVALKHSAIIVFNQDMDLHYTWMHNAPVGFAEANFIGKTDADLFSDEERKRLYAVKKGVLDTGVGTRVEVQWPETGESRSFDVALEPVRDQNGTIIGLTGVAMDITERKRLEREISAISEMEQQRLGQDLHDGICQHLAGIELMSQVLEQNLEKKSKRQAAQAGEIAKNVRDVIGQTRSLARGLSPVTVESEGLMAALKELAEKTEHLFRVKCHFHCKEPVLISNNTVATHLFRIAQEAVSNAIKHGHSHEIDIALSKTAEKVILTVQNDGESFTPRAGSSGMGLRIMQYRAGMIGGTLTIRPEQRGTLVTCSISNNERKS